MSLTDQIRVANPLRSDVPRHGDKRFELKLQTCAQEEKTADFGCPYPGPAWARSAARSGASTSGSAGMASWPRPAAPCSLLGFS